MKAKENKEGRGDCHKSPFCLSGKAIIHHGNQLTARSSREREEGKTGISGCKGFVSSDAMYFLHTYTEPMAASIG